MQLKGAGESRGPVPEELLSAVLNRRYSLPVAVTTRHADVPGQLADVPGHQEQEQEPPEEQESLQEPKRPRLAVLGAGDYGRAFATRAVRSGYQVSLGSRNPDRK